MSVDAGTRPCLAAENRLTVAESIFHVAVAGRDRRLSYEAALEYLKARYYVPGDHANSLEPFSHVVEIMASKPDWWTEKMTRRVLWEYKSILNCLCGQPETDLSLIKDLIVEMAQLFDDHGYDPRPVTRQEARLKLLTEGATAAASSHQQWKTSSRTQLCDCIACEPTAHVEFLVAASDLTGIVDTGLELLARHGDQQCVHEPQGRYALLVEPLLTSGHERAAAWAQSCSLYLDRNQPVRSRLLIHAHVLARSGHVHRAAEVFQLAGMQPAGDPYDEALSLARAANVAERLAVSLSPLTFGVSVVSCADDLSAQLADRALDLADAFDRRNNTTTVSDKVQDLIERGDLPPVPAIDWTPTTLPPV